jgi:hypothetical protein
LVIYYRTLSSALLIGLLASACADETTPSEPDTTSTVTDVASSEGDATATDGDGATSTPGSDVETPPTDPPEDTSATDGEDVEAPAADVGEPEEDTESPVSNWPEVVINEVAARGVPADWIEIVNRSGDAVDLSGWTVTDDDPEHVHAFESGQMLGAGAYLLLLKEDAGGFTFGLGDMDSVVLYAPDGAVVDTTTWEDGQSPQDTSWGRMPNGSCDFMTLETPTPGGVNASNAPQDCGNDAIELGEVCDGIALDDKSCEGFNFASGELGCSVACDAFDTSGCVPPSRIVVINEVTSSDDDRIELLNVSMEPVVITGWTLSDKDTAEPDQLFTIPAGMSLAPGAYAVFTKDVDHSFGLGGNDKLILRDDTGVLIDRINWSKDEAEVSYCLIPNGGDTAQVCDEASFGGPNVGEPIEE